MLFSAFWIMNSSACCCFSDKNTWGHCKEFQKQGQNNAPWKLLDTLTSKFQKQTKKSHSFWIVVKHANRVGVTNRRQTQTTALAIPIFTFEFDGGHIGHMTHPFVVVRETESALVVEPELTLQCPNGRRAKNRSNIKISLYKRVLSASATRNM